MPDGFLVNPETGKCELPELVPETSVMVEEWSPLENETSAQSSTAGPGSHVAYNIPSAACIEKNFTDLYEFGSEWSELEWTEPMYGLITVLQTRTQGRWGAWGSHSSNLFLEYIIDGAWVAVPGSGSRNSRIEASPATQAEFDTSRSLPLRQQCTQRHNTRARCLCFLSSPPFHLFRH